MSLNLNDVVTDGSAKFQVVKNATTNDITNAIDNFKNKVGYRQKNKTYAIGDIAYHSDLPTGCYLECTTAGTTSSGDLVISSPSIGSTMTDGTVTWTVGKIFSLLLSPSFLDLNDYNMPGVYNINRNTGKQNIPDGMNYGLMQVLSNGVSFDKAQFIISRNNSMHYRGYSAYGTWNPWLQNEAIVTKSLSGANGYIKYASGLIMQWGTNDMAQNWDANNNIITITFPISFITSRTVVVSHNDAEDANTNVLISSKNAQNPLSSCVFRRYSVDGANQFYGEFHWIAIGY